MKKKLYKEFLVITLIVFLAVSAAIWIHTKDSNATEQTANYATLRVYDREGTVIKEWEKVTDVHCHGDWWGDGKWISFKINGAIHHYVLYDCEYRTLPKK